MMTLRFRRAISQESKKPYIKTLLTHLLTLCFCNLLSNSILRCCSLLRSTSALFQSGFRKSRSGKLAKFRLHRFHNVRRHARELLENALLQLGRCCRVETQYAPNHPQGCHARFTCRIKKPRNTIIQLCAQVKRTMKV